MTQSAKTVPRPLDVAVLVFDACNTLSFAAAVDPMRAANRLAGRSVFKWRCVTATGEPAKLTSGIEVPGPALGRLERCDFLVLVAGFDLAAHATPRLAAGLRRIAASGATLAGIDGGPWLMAQAGLLDGHSATTHWEDLDAFARTFPEVEVVPDRVRQSGTRLTCAGALPAIDMMLDLVARQGGAALARQVAAVFIHDRPAAPELAQSRAGPDPRHSRTTRHATALMEQALDAPIPIAGIAARLGIGSRSLEQQFRDRLGLSPQTHYLRLRMAEALRLVRDTDLPLTEVALATGYASPSGFARAFRRAHGRSARAMRQGA